MIMPTLRKKTDDLSAAAREILARGAKELRPARFVAQEILDATGETVAERTVARRLAELRGEEERRRLARERYADLVRAIDGGNLSAPDALRALAYQQLMDNPDALSGENALDLQRTAIAAEELRLKRRALEVRERGLAVVEKRLELLEEKEKRAREILDASKGEQISDEERLRKARELYGL